MANGNNPSGLNQVGMGVYLDDGVSTLAQLRAIRQEMEAINRLSGRTTAGGSGADSGQSRQSAWEQELVARERAEVASINRMARARRDALGYGGARDNNEIEILARQKASQIRMREEVTRRANELHKEQLASEERELKNSLSRRARMVQDAMSDPRIYTSGPREQARLFQRHRNDPARFMPGDRTQEFRNEIAALRWGQRSVINEQKRAHRDYQAEQDRLGREAVRAEISRSNQLAQARRRANFKQIDDNREWRYNVLQQDRARIGRQQARIQQARVFQQAGLQIPDSLTNAMGYSFPSSRYRSDPIDQATYGGRINPGTYTGDPFMQRAYQRLGRGGTQGPLPGRGTIASSQQFASAGKIGSSALSGTRSVLGTDFNLGVAGRITRNILLYEVVSQASYGLVNYIGNAITAAKTTVEFANALRFATEQADGNLAQTQKLADSMLDIGLSRQQGRAAVVEAARFAEGRPQDITALTQIGADIAAARGLGIDRTDELIEQLRRRESKFYKRLFGTTVESIYENEAAAAIDSQGVSPTATPGLYIGLDPQEIKSRREQIAAYVAAMDDEAKENSVLNYILAQSNRFHGEAAERANTLAGRLDKLSAAWLNGQEGLGLFITDLKVVNDILELLSGKVGVLDNLRGPEIGRTGERGTISRFDIEQYGRARTQGPRAELLSFIDNYGLPIVGGLAAAGFAGGIGRRDALIGSQNRTYFNTYNKGLGMYGGNPYLAQQFAIQQAQGAKAGVFNSIGSGATRLTAGFTNTIGGWFGRPDLIGQRPTPGVQRAGPRYGPNAYIPSAQGPFSPIINPQLQSRLDQLQGAFAAGGGIAGGILGATVGSFIASKIEAGTIVSAGLTILGGAAGTGIGSFIGNAVGSFAAGKLAAAGGFSTLGAGALALGNLGVGTLATGVGSVGGVGIGALAGLGLVGGVALGGLGLGYGVGSLISDPINRIIGGPRAQELEDERRLAAIEAADPAFRAATRERQNAYQQGRLRFRSNAVGAPTGLLTGAEVRQLGLSPGSLEEVIVSRRESESLTRGQGLLNLREAAQRLGINADVSRTSSLTGNVTTEFDPTKVTQEYNRQIAEVQRNIQQVSLIDPTNEEELKALRAQLSRLQGEAAQVQNAADRELALRQPGTFINADGSIGGLVSEDYRAKALEREIRRKEKEEKAFREETAEIEQGLAKIREAGRNSYQVVGEIAAAMVGEDNPYVKVLSDQLTLAERMQQQWGYLGKSAVDYFTTLNRQALNRQLLQIDYQAYERATGFTEQAAREAAAREAPGLTRRERNITDIYGASLGSLSTFQNNRLNTQRMFGTRFAQDIYGFNQSFRPLDLARQGIGEVSALLGYGTGYGIGPSPDRTFDVATGRYFSLDARNADQYGAFTRQRASLSGLSKEAQEKVGEMFSGAFFDIIGNLDEQQLRSLSRDPGFRDAYVTAINAQQASANRKVVDAIQIAKLDVQESDRLDAQLAQDERYRRDMIFSGRNPRDVGRASDALFLRRTEGIDPKDLTFNQFQTRQDILKRQAEREETDRQEAVAATLTGLKYQQMMIGELATIRAAILGGDAQMLIQVQNDTAARVDKAALDSREAVRAGGGPNPYSQGSLGNYPQGGN